MYGHNNFVSIERTFQTWNIRAEKYVVPHGNRSRFSQLPVSGSDHKARATNLPTQSNKQSEGMPHFSAQLFHFWNVFSILGDGSLFTHWVLRQLPKIIRVFIAADITGLSFCDSSKYSTQVVCGFLPHIVYNFTRKMFLPFICRIRMLFY